MTESPPKATILCVDDNQLVAQALESKLSREPGFSWKGWLPSADNLIDTVRSECPAIVLLDLDMPGRDPFEALTELSRECPDTRCIILTGHVRADLIDKAIESGAWGYVSKNEGEAELLRTIEKVLEDEFTLSPQVRAALGA